MGLFAGKQGRYVYPFDDHRSGMPTIDVQIGLDRETARRQGDRHTIPISALLDTGAHCSFIDESTVDELGLKPVSRRVLRSPIVAQGVSVWVFPVSITVLGRRRHSAYRNVAVVPSANVAMTLVPSGMLRQAALPRVVIGRGRSRFVPIRLRRHQAAHHDARLLTIGRWNLVGASSVTGRIPGAAPAPPR